MEIFGPSFAGDDTARLAMEKLRIALQERHRGAVRSLIFYGSCLRSGDLRDGLVDLYVIVDSYRHAHRSVLAAIGNRLLAPNVYYLQVESGGQTVRCKYAVLSEADLARGVSPSRFESYLWGRLCQHAAIAWAMDERALTAARAALRQATISFLDNALPLAASKGYIVDVWSAGLACSYATELRSEDVDRAAAIVEASSVYVLAATNAVADALRWSFNSGGEFYSCSIPETACVAARRDWARRRMLGKPLSVLRLLKALSTFEDGLDYIAWKLERHTGRMVDIPERVRRFPLIFIWGLMWKLYRDGVFR
jgi:hypothetical protein